MANSPRIRDTPTPLPQVRRPQLDFDPQQIPRWWHDNSVFLTHAANGLSFVFPAGERFFVRSVRRYLHQIHDPQLLARVKAFIGQESQHGRQHERAFEMLEAQGYEIRSFLAWYERTAYQRIEPRTSPILRLATTVALEHLTAVMGERALTTDMLNGAHPTLAALMRWHAAEEIEHKAVAFDVLQEIDPRYLTRIAGMVVGITVLLWFWSAGTRHLLRQEPAVSWRRLRREQKEAARRGINRRYLARAVLDYLRPGFHPDQRDNYHLAESYLSRLSAQLEPAPA